MKYLLLVVFVHAAAAAVLKERAPCGQFCTEQYDPVCGTDGVTYSNPCFLNIASCHDSSISMAHKGRCGHRVRQSCPMICFAVYNPVCGSDGKTYSNSCALNSANQCDGRSVTIAHQGPCDGDLLLSR